MLKLYVYAGGEKRLLIGMIAQGRVSENLCTIELAHLSQNDSLYCRPSLAENLPGCYCMLCTLPTGLKNVNSLLGCKLVEGMSADWNSNQQVS